MSMRAGHTIRWAVVWGCIALWFIALGLDIGGNLVHVLLLVAAAMLVYELLVPEPPPG